MTKTVLITGISGFIAKHTAVAFLNAGYAVRGTVRSAAKGEQVRATLSKHADTADLSIVEADLMNDAGWDQAVSGVDGIAHIASPFPLAQPKDENELIRPAVDGTLRVLELAKKHGVPRFVQTSSTAAVVGGHGKDRTEPFTEDDWTNVEAPGVSPYAKSKTLAERAARDFIAGDGAGIHYSSVNPGFVLGPALDNDIGTSHEAIAMILKGSYPALPRIAYTCVDVRDIAEMHLRAMETNQPSGGRYVGVSSLLWFVEISRIIRNNLGEAGRKAPTRQLPDFAVRLLALFDPAARAIAPDLGRVSAIDNSRTRKALDMVFRPAQEAVIASAESLVELKLV
jgi:dihydroflavonol-4-reductase